MERHSLSSLCYDRIYGVRPHTGTLPLDSCAFADFYRHCVRKRDLRPLRTVWWAGYAGSVQGNFKNFVSYTAQVNSFLPGRAIPALAVVESFIEGGLGIAMLLGLAVRPVSLLSAAAFRLGCCDDCFPGHKFSIQLCCLRLGRRGICDRKRRCNTSQLGCASRARQTKTLYGVKRISSTKLYPSS